MRLILIISCLCAFVGFNLGAGYREDLTEKAFEKSEFEIGIVKLVRAQSAMDVAEQGLKEALTKSFSELTKDELDTLKFLRTDSLSFKIASLIFASQHITDPRGLRHLVLGVEKQVLKYPNESIKSLLTVVSQKTIFNDNYKVLSLLDALSLVRVKSDIIAEFAKNRLQDRRLSDLAFVGTKRNRIINREIIKSYISLYTYHSTSDGQLVRLVADTVKGLKNLSFQSELVKNFVDKYPKKTTEFYQLLRL